jgi:hypothetical protein
MTDYQFKSIMALVVSTLDNCKTLEDYENAKNTFRELSGKAELRELAEKGD